MSAYIPLLKELTKILNSVGAINISAPSGAGGTAYFRTRLTEPNDLILKRCSRHSSTGAPDSFQAFQPPAIDQTFV
jgi:hypothetical protein